MNLPVDLLFSLPLFFFFFFFLSQGDNTLTNDASLVFSTLIYFRLQSSSIAGCWKCVCGAKKKWRS